MFIRAKTVSTGVQSTTYNTKMSKKCPFFERPRHKNEVGTKIVKKRRKASNEQVYHQS